MQFNIFKRLDISSVFFLCFFFSLSWLFLVIGFYYKNTSFYLIYKRVLNVFSVTSSFENRSLIYKGQLNFLSNSFCLLIIMKVFGLLPYVVGITSQVWFALILGFIRWIRIVISSFLYKKIYFFSHFTPRSSPLSLVPLLKLIELVSLKIRPLTLTLRLSIKISTGHILLTLLSFSLLSCYFKKRIYLLLVLFVMFFYFFFELFVCIIQAFVWKLLIVQYIEEHSK